MNCGNFFFTSFFHSAVVLGSLVLISRVSGPFFSFISEFINWGGGQRSIYAEVRDDFEEWFSPSTMRVPEIKLRSLGFGEGTFGH